MDSLGNKEKARKRRREAAVGRDVGGERIDKANEEETERKE